MPQLVRLGLAVVVVVHGVVHILGFLATWELAEIGTLGRPSLEAGSGPPLAFGLLWLVAMLGFVASGIGMALETAWADGLAKASAVVSLVVTIPWWSDAWVGAVVSAVILVALLLVNPLKAATATAASSRRDADSVRI